MNLEDKMKTREIKNTKTHLSNLLQTEASLKEQLDNKSKEIADTRSELERLENGLMKDKFK